MHGARSARRPPQRRSRRRRARADGRARARGPCWHFLAGRQAADLGVDLLVAVGDGARGYLDGATGRIACLWFPDTDSAVAALHSLLRRSDVVLLKGSHTAGLEQLAEKLAR